MFFYASFLDFIWDVFVYELYVKQLAAMTSRVQAVFPGHHGKGEGAAP